MHEYSVCIINFFISDKIENNVWYALIFLLFYSFPNQHPTIPRACTVFSAKVSRFGRNTSPLDFVTTNG